MTGWQIDPAVVASVLTDVEAKARSTDGLAGAVPEDDVRRVVSYTSWGFEYTQVVHQALEALLTGVEDDVGAIAGRIVAGVLGVGAAATAYQQGQQDMTEQELAMMASATDGDFSWFVAHGYLDPAP